MSKIKIRLKKQSDYINEFNDDRISSELNDYILEESKVFGPKDPVEILISSNFEMNDEEKKKLIEMIKSSYKDDIVELEILSRKLYITNFFMFILGILCLTVYMFFKEIPVVTDVILIIGWVSIWEVTYNILFSSVENRIKLSKRKNLVNSKITFK